MDAKFCYVTFHFFSLCKSTEIFGQNKTQISASLVKFEVKLELYSLLSLIKNVKFSAFSFEPIKDRIIISCTSP